MNPFFKKVFSTLLPRQYVCHCAHKMLIKDPESYLYQTGWMASLSAGKPIDHNGNPVPWMNFSVIRLLEERLTPDLQLFEYGSGYSTLFYAARVASVVSVEYDQGWFEIIGRQLPANARLLFTAKDSDGHYCRSIVTTGQRYDLVVVDGRDRVNCVLQSLEALTERGVILLDDSQRDRYRPALERATARGFRALTLAGLKATAATLESTTIFYRDGNCLGL